MARSILEADFVSVYFNCEVGGTVLHLDITAIAGAFDADVAPCHVVLGCITIVANLEGPDILHVFYTSGNLGSFCSSEGSVVVIEPGDNVVVLSISLNNVKFVRLWSGHHVAVSCQTQFVSQHGDGCQAHENHGDKRGNFLFHVGVVFCLELCFVMYCRLSQATICCAKLALSSYIEGIIMQERRVI